MILDFFFSQKVHLKSFGNTNRNTKMIQVYFAEGKRATFLKEKTPGTSKPVLLKKWGVGRIKDQSTL